MKVICAKCKKHLEGNKADPEVSHGICPKCEDKTWEEKLKKCPFCDGKGRLEQDCPNVPDAYVYWIVCNSCAATGGWGKSKGSAVKWWNLRMCLKDNYKGKSKFLTFLKKIGAITTR